MTPQCKTRKSKSSKIIIYDWRTATILDTSTSDNCLSRSLLCPINGLDKLNRQAQFDLSDCLTSAATILLPNPYASPSCSMSFRSFVSAAAQRKGQWLSGDLHTVHMDVDRRARMYPVCRYRPVSKRRTEPDTIIKNISDTLLRSFINNPSITRHSEWM